MKLLSALSVLVVFFVGFLLGKDFGEFASIYYKCKERGGKTERVDGNYKCLEPRREIDLERP